ncbi:MULTISPECIES: hypothetical protein, partial [unclassified Oleiphilus]|uniref:hypothetical protein n=1 Tax=unclassified Oleiphilus TaxID=2631174 RepID=UPI000AE06E49
KPKLSLIFFSSTLAHYRDVTIVILFGIMRKLLSRQLAASFLPIKQQLRLAYSISATGEHHD